MSAAKLVLPVVVGCMAGMMLMTLGQGLIVASKQWVNTRDGSPTPMVDSDFVLLLAVYAVCSLIAGVASTLVYRSAKPLLPAIVGVLLTLAGLYNCRGIVHPGWFTEANLVAFIPFTLAGYFLARKSVKTTNA